MYATHTLTAFVRSSGNARAIVRATLHRDNMLYTAAGVRIPLAADAVFYTSDHVVSVVAANNIRMTGGSLSAKAFDEANGHAWKAGHTLEEINKHAHLGKGWSAKAVRKAYAAL